MPYTNEVTQVTDVEVSAISECFLFPICIFQTLNALFSFKNGLWLLKYAVRPTPKKTINTWSKKTSTDVKKKSSANDRER